MLISKKTLVIGIFFASLFPLSAHAMQNPHTPQNNFSKLALGQSVALCCLGTISHIHGKDLCGTIPSWKQFATSEVGSMLKRSGKLSIGLGLLSATYILSSKYKITQC